MGYFLVMRETERSSVEMTPLSLQKAAVVRVGPTIMMPSIRACPPMVVIFFAILNLQFFWEPPGLRTFLEKGS